MCIRDRPGTVESTGFFGIHVGRQGNTHFSMVADPTNAQVCLLYTSDAADERSSVDLGGRRIIKKKNSVSQDVRSKSSQYLRKTDRWHRCNIENAN